MTIRHDFNIAMPNQPYVDDFSDGNTQAATYVGHKFLKVEYNSQTGVIGRTLAQADDMETLNSIEVPAQEGFIIHIIDATQHPLQASYLSGNYETGEVADYTESLGTTDAEGNAESWTYYWQDHKGVIAQIYKKDTLKWVNNDFEGPEFRAHVISSDSFNASVQEHIANATSELAKDGVYTDEEKATITAYKTFLEGIATKYAGVKHWKIPFGAHPEYK